MTLVGPFDAAAPPEDAWGPMLVVALVVVAVVAMVVGFGRITRARRADRTSPGEGHPGPGAGGRRDGASGVGNGSSPEATPSDDELPTDPV